MRRRWFWFGWGWMLTLAGLLGFAVTVRAQSTITHMPLVQVALWPEYDRAAMLVMYIIHLPQDVSLPTEVAIRLPARVEGPTAVAVRTSEGRLLNADYRVDADPESEAWRLVIATATEPILHVEYYDPALKIEGAARHFVYHWPGNWTVDMLLVEVQQPRTAVALEVIPEPTRVEEREGLRYYLLDFGAVQPGQDIQVEVAYQNPTGELTSPQMPPAEGDTLPIQSGTTPQPRVSVLPWVLAGLGLLLIALAGWMYWRGSRVPARAVRRSSRRRQARTEAASTGSGEVRYCPQCGTRARPGDRFCRMCGTPLR